MQKCSENRESHHFSHCINVSPHNLYNFSVWFDQGLSTHSVVCNTSFQPPTFMSDWVVLSRKIIINLSFWSSFIHTGFNVTDVLIFSTQIHMAVLFKTFWSFCYHSLSVLSLMGLLLVLVKPCSLLLPLVCTLFFE